MGAGVDGLLELAVAPEPEPEPALLTKTKPTGHPHFGDMPSLLASPVDEQGPVAAAVVRKGHEAARVRSGRWCRAERCGPWVQRKGRVSFLSSFPVVVMVEWRPASQPAS